MIAKVTILILPYATKKWRSGTWSSRWHTIMCNSSSIQSNICTK